MRRIAAIDIGTVTARLLVADVGGGVVAEVARRSIITHLGEDLTRTGLLSAPAIERVGVAIDDFVAEARSLGAEQVLGVATSASRDAKNADEFLARVARSGVTPEIISGSREAWLSFLGATYALDVPSVLVVDVGGGSTELIAGTLSVAVDGTRTAEVTTSRSIDVGSRRITELFLASDPPTSAELAEAGAWAAGELRGFFGGLKQRPRLMVSVAGTATSLAAIDLALEPYDPARVHGYELSGSALSVILEELGGMTLARRREVPGLEPERAGVIVGGAIVLHTALALAGLDSTLASEHDILYGMVLDAVSAGDG